MDIFVRHIPEQSTRRQLQAFFQGPLEDCNVRVFDIDKHRDKPSAIITVLDARAGHDFLNRYGIPENALGKQQPLLRLHYAGKQIVCQKARNPPSDFALQSLAYAAMQNPSPDTSKTADTQKSKPKNQLNRFDITALECGVWDYTHDGGKGSQLVFTSHFTDNRRGQIIIGRKEAIILLGPTGHEQSRIDLRYDDCVNVNLGSYGDPSVTFSLSFAPKIYKIPAHEDIAAIMGAMSLLGFRLPAKPQKVRLPAINQMHAKVAGCCFTYRVTLANSKHLPPIHTILKRVKCEPTSYETSTHNTEDLGMTFGRLNHLLSDVKRFGARPFRLRWQIDRLARNGLLTPAKVIKLLPKIEQIHDTYGLEPTLFAFKHFGRILRSDPPGPNVDPYLYSTDDLAQLLEQKAATYNTMSPDNPYELAKRHTHIEMVHKIIVTPAGTYLQGPEPEPTNRVLRKYSHSADHFARLIFQDEDGASVRYDPRTNLHEIYHSRFKSALDLGFIVCGRSFSFLGFSHSSLRNRTCWLMAPVVTDGRLTFAEKVIKDLGNFSHIRIPAKCAARIGQNFTDTNAAVELQPDQVSTLPIIFRNGRDFSDGVGTISLELLHRVWRVYGPRRLLKPTALQIRFQGAKGMVSLDTRLKGQVLMLRENMKKFLSHTTWHLEICNAAFRPMPMVLNRQFIKILEDLGIPMNVFMDLQEKATDRLWKMTESSINAATLLQEIDGTKATKLPLLIRNLGEIGLDFHQDEFLYRIVEMAVATDLREIKYRGRIPVPEGVTLYGIMDETGFLKEGEIYVVTEKPPEGGQEVLVRDRVIVTRSPALHPGDLQVVKAVDVPDTSPLKELSNVVVFSQYGERDMPSQLSGGDLDGDLYNIMWHSRMIPKETYPAADYPRKEALELDREVTRKDMSDFFVTFMESDQLGQIATRHLQLADQREAGTCDPDCIRFAEMASTAVDFSKTGIPVDMSEAPKHDRCRPDFMAPNPRVSVSDAGYLEFEDDDPEDDEAFEGIDSEFQPMRYYASKKTLGYLYRKIDERQFLAKMQDQRRAAIPGVKPGGDLVMRLLLRYVQHWAKQYGVSHRHQMDLAADIRATYEENLLNILYDYEPTPRSPLSEAEAFAGQILGRQGGQQGRPLRELSTTMRERFETVAEYAVMRITKGDQTIKEAREAGDLDELYDDSKYHDREFEALPRALACLEVAVKQTGCVDRQVGELKSFRYIAAMVCLKELERYRITTFGSMGLPPFPQDTRGKEVVSWAQREGPPSVVELGSV